ncbi:MAG TPA: VWA domain-containing protein [Polyangium sp.]|nr:VWA domain-containing protein [Polyangium sp.]
MTDSESTDPLEPLKNATPELRAMAESVGLGEWIGDATYAVAKRLSGHPPSDPGPLGALWFVIADGELRVLEAACGKEPLRAASCAIAWIAHVLRHHGAEKTRTPPKDEKQKWNVAKDEEVSNIQAALQQLMQRQVPNGFPPPVQGTIPKNTSTLELGSRIRKNLDVDGAMGAGMAAARQCDDVMLALGTLVPGLGWDFSQGHLHQTLLFQLEKLSALLSRLPTLRRIADELGRAEVFQRRARRALAGGRESVVGVRVGGDIADALVCELALLASPETEDLFFQRFIERRLLCLELEGTTTEVTPRDERRGPAIACVDTSGSMQGAPEAVAKALILTVIKQLVPKGRSVQLLLFGGPGESTPLEIRRGRRGLNDLLKFLAMGFHAGTDYDTPLLRATELLKTPEYAKADILVVTDGLCRASERIASHVDQSKKQANARVLSVVVGGDMAGVERFSDQVWRLDPNAPVTGGIDVRAWSKS